ncbi:MAG: two-CW domain-containing protein [Betaproteobacteria bacterium]
MKLEDIANKNSGVGKKNCWEHKSCGREPGGARAKELGVCPVTTHEELHGAHGGKNAGRACWVIAGSLCGGKMQGTYAQKLSNCWRCDFFNTVKKEEDPTSHGFSTTRLGMEKVIEKGKK